MKDSLAVDVLDGFQELIHIVFDLFGLQIFVPNEALVEVLLHEFEY